MICHVVAELASTELAVRLTLMLPVSSLRRAGLRDVPEIDAGPGKASLARKTLLPPCRKSESAGCSSARPADPHERRERRGLNELKRCNDDARAAVPTGRLSGAVPAGRGE